MPRLFVFVVEGNGQVDVYAECYGEAVKKLEQKFGGCLDYRKYYLERESSPVKGCKASYYRNAGYKRIVN